MAAPSKYPGAPVTVVLAHAGPNLRVTVENVSPSRAPGPREQGGHGLIGLRGRDQQLGGAFRS